MNAVIYARVSSVTDRQRTDRQVADLTNYANANNYNVAQVFTEHISGTKKNEERVGLQACKAYCNEGKANLILCSELSRLSRSVYELQDTIKWAHDNKINIYFQKEGIALFDKDGKESILFPILVACLGFVAETERENIKFRLNSGRKQAIDKGVKMGRKQGSVKSHEQKAEEYAQVLSLLKKKISVRNVAAITGRGVATIARVKKEFGI